MRLHLDILSHSAHPKLFTFPSADLKTLRLALDETAFTICLYRVSNRRFLNSPDFTRARFQFIVFIFNYINIKPLISNKRISVLKIMPISEYCNLLHPVNVTHFLLLFFIAVKYKHKRKHKTSHIEIPICQIPLFSIVIIFTSVERTLVVFVQKQDDKINVLLSC